MEDIKLYRKRFIPSECILLNRDVILHLDEDILVTKWNTIRPKKVLHHGLSCYFLREGFKISKFYDKNNRFICWYCDIVEHEYDEDKGIYTFIDLLSDVIIYPDKTFKVVDLDELADAFEQQLIDERQLKQSLRVLDNLLRYVYSNKFSELTRYIEYYETL